MRTYLEINALLALSYALFRVLTPLLKYATDRLRLAHALLLASVIFPVLAWFLPKQALLRPAVQVWSGLNRNTREPYFLVSPLPQLTTSAVGDLSGVVIQNGSFWILLSFVLVGALVVLARLFLHGFRLRQALSAMPVVKRIGRVQILTSDDAPSPFSTWLPFGGAFVVLPMRDLADAGRRRISILHEIQHHRQGDTHWLYLIAFFRAVFFWNPAVYGWSQTLSLTQEFACDEVLVGRRNVSPQVYGSCLLQAAESAVGSRFLLVGTTGMAASASGHLLKWRIEMLFAYKRQSSRKWPRIVLSVGTLFLMATAAFASRSAVQDRTVTLSEAQKWVKIASEGAVIPITVNDLVLAKLNRFIGTPEGRKFVKNGLIRMPQYRAMIEGRIREYGHPDELLAVALFESGFENDALSPHRALGIWQFIPQTARNYDLVVNEKVDERLDAAKETVAAMRYLKKLNSEFQDWRLALMAYNEGESRVARNIEKYHTRDPWELERLDTKESYLSGVMAMMIILKNPSVLD